MFLSCIHSYNYEELWADAHSYGYLTDMNWVFFTRILSIKSLFFICEVEDGEPVAQEGETKNPRWINESEMRDLVENHPEQIFGLQLPVWRHYFNLC